MYSDYKPLKGVFQEFPEPNSGVVTLFYPYDLLEAEPNLDGSKFSIYIPAGVGYVNLSLSTTRKSILTVRSEISEIGKFTRNFGYEGTYNYNQYDILDHFLDTTNWTKGKWVFFEFNNYAIPNSYHVRYRDTNTDYEYYSDYHPALPKELQPKPTKYKELQSKYNNFPEKNTGKTGKLFIYYLEFGSQPTDNSLCGIYIPAGTEWIEMSMNVSNKSEVFHSLNSSPDKNQAKEVVHRTIKDLEKSDRVLTIGGGSYGGLIFQGPVNTLNWSRGKWVFFNISNGYPIAYSVRMIIDSNHYWYQLPPEDPIKEIKELGEENYQYSIRDQDNFENSRQYIINILFPHNYENSQDVHILKMKLKVLDGWIETDLDTDVENPKDHWATLQNDLVYLNKYIRTKEEILEENEINFYDFWEQRIKQKEKWLNTIKDQETNETYEDYEQPYNSRPTLLNQKDFEDIYQEFIVRDDLDNSFQITTKIINQTLDHRIKQHQSQIFNQKPSSEIEENLLIEAEKKKNENDDLYVKNMRDIHDEIFDLILTYKDDAVDSLPEGYTEYDLVLVNFPHKREYIQLTENHSSHKGPIIIQTGEGGYRFILRNLSYGEWKTYNVNNDYLTGELEDTWSEWLYCYYDNTQEDLLSTGVNIHSLSTVDRNRFDDLNDRWITINNMREYQIMNTGTRTIIEQMINADVPELLPDMENHLTDLINLKEWFTDILVDNNYFDYTPEEPPSDPEPSPSDEDFEYKPEPTKEFPYLNTTWFWAGWTTYVGNRKPFGPGVRFDFTIFEKVWHAILQNDILTLQSTWEEYGITLYLTHLSQKEMFRIDSGIYDDTSLTEEELSYFGNIKYNWS